MGNSNHSAGNSNLGSRPDPSFPAAAAPEASPGSIMEEHSGQISQQLQNLELGGLGGSHTDTARTEPSENNCNWQDVKNKKGMRMQKPRNNGVPGTCKSLADQLMNSKNKPTGRLRKHLEGEVIKLCEGFGFMKLLSDSQQQEEDIYFRYGTTQTGFLDLQVGDVLEFGCSNSEAKSRRAVFARLVRCRRRSPVNLARYLDSLLQKTSGEEVLAAIVRCPVAFLLVLAIQNPCKEIILSILELCNSLCKHAEASLNRARLQMFFGFFRGTRFLKVLGEYVCGFCNAADEDLMPVLGGFVRNSVKYVPEMGTELVKMMISSMQASFLEENTPVAKFCRVLVELISVSFKGTSDSSSEAVNWDEMPLVPFVDELVGDFERTPLPCVRKQGSYGSVESYIDTYFRLLREDCFGPLKEGIRALKTGRLDIRDMKVWNNVTVVGFKFNERQPGVTVVMTAERLLKSEKGKKRYISYAPPMQGNLICISCDCKEGNSLSFKCPIWAAVFKSEDNNDKIQVWAEIIRGPSIASDSSASVCQSLARLLLATNGSVIIVENPSFYKSYEPVLRGLQEMEWPKFPFLKEIVMARWTCRPPDYLANSSAMVDWSCIFGEPNPLVAEINAGDSLVKSGYKLVLDDSQFKAVKLALRNRLVLIQGPPGTGKTFIGTKILQMLLSANTLPWGPALVITYKNQGLDNFLLGCLKFCPTGLVRVGGGSTEESLDVFNLRALVSKHDKFAPEYNETREKLEAARVHVEKAIQLVCDSSFFDVDSFLAELNDLELREFIFENQKYDQQVLNLIPDGMTVTQILNTDSPGAKPLKKSIIDSLQKWLPRHEIFENVKECLRPPSSVGLLDSLVIEGTNEVQEESEELNIGIEQFLDAKREEEASNAGLSVTADTDKDSKTAGDCVFKPEIGNKKGGFKKITLYEIYKEQHQWLMDEKLWELNQYQRAILVQIIMDKNRQKAIKNLEEAKKAYDDICNALADIDKKRKLNVLKEAKIVGMTVTGVAMNQEIVSALKPAIVFVEEAAEVLEPQLIAAICPSVQHLILIGDHYQLSPSVELYELEKRHDFAVSLFERLVEHNGMPYQSLMCQSRMREEFVPMIKPIYPKIRTNQHFVSGERNKSPDCMATPMYFWSHSHKEDEKRSVTNRGEATMVVALVQWLLSEGQVPEEMTILCAYNGQANLLKRMLNNADSPKVQVVTIDRFQGSENRVIILSLVRSNDKSIIGHLGKRNRMCVAVSRARGAFYMCGNMTTLTKRSEHWAQLLNYMSEENCVGEAIPFKCPRHPDKTYTISNNEADNFNIHVCGRPCIFQMDCGHACNAPCHFGNHPKCKETVNFVYKMCGHQGVRKCSVTEDMVPCQQEVVYMHALCGHMEIVLCWKKFKSQLKCLEPCRKILECGHPCQLECYKDCEKNECGTCIAIEKAKQEQEKKLRIEHIKLTRKTIEAELKRLKSETPAVAIRDLTGSGSTAADYMQVRDRTEKFIQPGHNMVLIVTGIQKVFNPTLEIKFLEARRDLIEPDVEPQLLFHGTSDEGVEGITKEGFRLPAANKNNMFGRGCYFATDSSKSAQRMYTKDSNKLLLCAVLLGKPWTVNKDYPDMDAEKLRKKGYDSLYSMRGGRGSGGTLYDEYVVYDPRQATPRYIVHFRFMGDPKPLSASMFPNDFTRIPIKPSETFSGSTSNEFHFRIAESQFYRMSSDRSSHKVLQVDVIFNKPLENRYELAKSQMGTASTEMLVFHGTRKEAIDNIIEEGFKIGGDGVNVRNGSSYGSGVYTALDPDISIPYSGGQGMMLLSLALVGSIGSDYVHGGSKDVLVFKRSEFLLPRYVVHFK